jgi:hypothetical protein
MLSGGNNMIRALTQESTAQFIKNYGRGVGTISLKNFRGRPFATEEDMSLLAYTYTQFSGGEVAPSVYMRGCTVTYKDAHIHLSKIVFDDRMLQIHFYVGKVIEFSLNYADILNITQLETNQPEFRYAIRQIDWSLYTVVFY